MNIALEGSVLIFDEAHNIEDVSRSVPCLNSDPLIVAISCGCLNHALSTAMQTVALYIQKLLQYWPCSHNTVKVSCLEISRLLHSPLAKHAALLHCQ